MNEAGSITITFKNSRWKVYVPMKVVLCVDNSLLPCYGDTSLHLVHMDHAGWWDSK